MSHYLALDFGAESGRGVLGRLENGRLEISEVHRWPNVPVSLPDGLHWNPLGLYSEMKDAIRNGARSLPSGETLKGVAVDTWGVDYALLDSRGEMMGTPYHYRDRRTDGVMDRILERIPRSRIFGRTGIQFMQINTLFQLAAARESGSPLLDAAYRLLFMPDLFNYWLSGEISCELTIASTSQMYDPTNHEWAADLMDDLGIPSRLFLPVTQPGSQLGELRESLAQETGAGTVPVLNSGSHDTASAVAAVPASSPDFAYLSSGTWSLIGIELPTPAITPTTLAGNFTNEGGVSGTIRFLKNIMGLWLVQECRRSWARQGKDYTYADLAELAAQAPAFACFVDPDEPAFLAPPDMPAAIASYCARTGQKAPVGPGPTVRACLEGLAFKYRENMQRLEEIAARPIRTLHIVGGGVQNRLLCQFAANATGKSVAAGPVEATAAGNLLVQAMAQGEIASLSAVRHVVRSSFTVDEYEPAATAPWEDAYGRFAEFTGKAAAATS